MSTKSIVKYAKGDTEVGLRLFEQKRQREDAALELCKSCLGEVEPDPAYADPANPTRGKCYYASVALLVYLGGAKAGYHLLKADDKLGAHYWVETQERRRLDPTAEQFVIMGRLPPYASGKRVSFRYNFTKHLPILHAMQRAQESED